MNGAIRKLLFLAAACACIVPGAVATVANKTHFSPRNELQQNGRFWAVSAPYTQAAQGERGITTTSLVFGSKSTNTVGLGRRFGSSLKSDYSDANGALTVALSSLGLPNGLFDRQIDHTYSTGGGAASMSGSLKLAPVQKRFGTTLGMDVDLGKILSFNGWHFSVVLPVVNVVNNLGLTYPTSIASANKTPTGTIQQFFAGNYTQGGHNSQQALMFGKLTTDDLSSCGIADMKVAVAYDIAREIDGAVQIRGGVIIPFGAHPTAEYLFEAIHGNGGHSGIFAGGRGDLLLWENKEKGMALWGMSDSEFTFLFNNREKRINGIFNKNTGLTVPWGHAALGIRSTVSGTFPLANVLTQDMDVMPGAHFDTTFGLTFIYKDFFFNAGYNMFFCEKETLDIATQWPVDRYGVACYSYDATPSSGAVSANFTGTALSSSASAVGPVNLPNSSSLATHIAGAAVVYESDPSVCTGDDQETHQLLLGAGYRRVVRGIPFDAAVFASYEFPFDASKAICGWALGGKISMYF